MCLILKSKDNTECIKYREATHSGVWCYFYIVNQGLTPFSIIDPSNWLFSHFKLIRAEETYMLYSM